MLERFPRLRELIEAREPFVCATIVDARGHVPQGPGAQVLVSPHGLIEGTVGGGEIEARVIAHAQKLLADEDPRAPKNAFVTWNLQRDVDMSCGGEISLFFEVFFRHDWRITIFGAGHVAQKLVPLLLTFECRVTCIDSRAEWLERLPRSPKLIAKLVEGSDSRQAMALEADRVSEQDVLLVITQGHGHDAPILARLLARMQPRFVGVIGSDVKGQALKRELQEGGLSREICDRIQCPVGLPLGSNDPAEIAVSIAAQLLQERDRLRGSRWE